MASLRIILLCVVAAVCYGEVHDQVTARLCVEYFTIGHPPVFHTDSPTLLALGWGVIATWWMGVLLGIPAALCAQAGSWPKHGAAQLVRPVGKLLLAMGCAAVVAGTIGYYLAQSGSIALRGPLATAVPAERHALFLTDLWAHSAAYAVGALGALGTSGWILRERRRLARSTAQA